jgi:hypothetical protein
MTEKRLSGNVDDSLSIMTRSSSEDSDGIPESCRLIALRWLALARNNTRAATPVFGQGTPGFGLDTSSLLNSTLQHH